MERSSTRRKPCSPNFGNTAGLTLIEMLVAMTVTLAISAGALSIALAGRNAYVVDRNRTAINQNLRNGIDFVGLDVRQAGERLPADFPAVELIDGGSGPDTLIIRRSIIDTILPVCKTINGGSSTDAIFVAKDSGSIPAGCAPVPDDDGDGWPENLEDWRDYRVGTGGEAFAFVFNPATGDGEFFTYDSEDNSRFHLHRSNSGAWQNDYPVADQPRIYLLEQRAFQVSGELLQVVINGDTVDPVNLVTNIVDFQVSIDLEDGSTVTTLGPTDDWTEIVSVEVALDGGRAFSGRTMDRSLTTRFFPRNVLSR
jgi:type IV pilus assembly protein PilW